MFFVSKLAFGESHRFEADDDGAPWPFYFMSELTVTPDTPLKELHEFAQRVSPYIQWYRATPIPHYRLAYSAYNAARKAGAVVLTDSEELELLEVWKGKTLKPAQAA